MRTDSARYARAEDTIIAPGHVSVAGEQLDLEGNLLELNLETQRMHLRDKVRVVVRPTTTPGPA